MTDIDTTLTEYITCPYCGWVDIDSWEQDDNGITWCGNCDLGFEFCRNVEVTYSTYKLNDKSSEDNP